MLHVKKHSLIHNTSSTRYYELKLTMCCRSCKDMPLSYCVKIYSLLCIAIGIFFAAWAVWASHDSFVRIRVLTRRGVFNLVYIILTFFAALSYILAGILMLIGTRMVRHMYELRLYWLVSITEDHGSLRVWQGSQLHVPPCVLYVHSATG